MNYPKVKLGEICYINMGKTPSRSKLQYWGPGFPWVSIADLSNCGAGCVICETKEQITTLAVKESGIKLVPANTLLYSFKLSIGKVAISKTELFTNEAIAALPIKDTGRVDIKYLYYAIQNINLSGIGDKAVKGLTLNKEKLQSLKIPLPDLQTQKHIASILDKADALRQQNRQLLNYYDELLQSTFIEMFGDPVKNTKHWGMKKLGEVSDSRLGKMLDAKRQSGMNRFKYLGNSNVLWGSFNLDGLLEMDFSEKDRLEFSLRKGDLLICEGGEVGRCAIWDEELSNCYFQKAIHRVRLHPTLVLPEYVQLLMWFYSKNGGLKDYVTAATIPHLTGVKLKSLPIPIPPLPAQSKFGVIVNQIKDERKQALEILAESEDLFQRLLKSFFNIK